VSGIIRAAIIKFDHNSVAAVEIGSCSTKRASSVSNRVALSRTSEGRDRISKQILLSYRLRKCHRSQRVWTIENAVSRHIHMRISFGNKHASSSAGRYKVTTSYYDLSKSRVLNTARTFGSTPSICRSTLVMAWNSRYANDHMIIHLLSDFLGPMSREIPGYYNFWWAEPAIDTWSKLFGITPHFLAHDLRSWANGIESTHQVWWGGKWVQCLLAKSLCHI